MTASKVRGGSTTRREWLGVIAVSTGTFAMVTVESLPVGLLTSIGRSLDVSDGTAGLMVTAPGLVASAAAPLLPLAIRRMDRRLVLLTLITLLVGSTLVSATAATFEVMLASRLLVGVAIGGFWALAAGLATRLVQPEQVPRATTVFFGAATTANVLGVPAATLLGGVADWRVAFAAVAGLGVLVGVAILTFLPPLPPETPVRLSILGAQLRVPAVRTGILATLFLVSGHWAAFTFASPALQEISGVSETAIGPVLLGFGAAGIAGNFVAGAMAARSGRQTLMGLGMALAVVLALFPVIGGSPVTGVTLLIAWGFAFGGIPVSVQSWIQRAADGSVEAATALNTSLFNLAIALGALTGGIVVDHVAVSGVLVFGAILASTTTLAVARVGR